MLQECGEALEDAVPADLAAEATATEVAAIGSPEVEPPAEEEKPAAAEPAAFLIGTPPQPHLEARTTGSAEQGKEFLPGRSQSASGSDGAARPLPFTPAPRSSSALDELAEDARDLQRRLGEAFPVDKMQNGFSAARGFMSWGFGRVAETATKISDDIAESEFAKETSRLVADAEVVVTKQVSEASKMAEASLSRARTNFEQLQQDLQPSLNEAQEKVREVTSGITEQVEPIAEKVRPHVTEAKETAKTGIFSAFSQAAKTAIWFQSLGAHQSDSEEEFARSPQSDQEAAAAAPAAAPSAATMEQASSSAARAPKESLVAPQPESLTAEVAASTSGGSAPSSGASSTPAAEAKEDDDTLLQRVVAPAPAASPSAAVASEVLVAGLEPALEASEKAEDMLDKPAIMLDLTE
mmetsp:Transcript_45597/g.105803  ORF Transcript_45597/g.105803 Transcript_45597/m.105803 type:complete len:410 (+) Transcript_45597:71-1300(+)